MTLRSLPTIKDFVSRSSTSNYSNTSQSPSLNLMATVILRFSNFTVVLHYIGNVYSVGLQVLRYSQSGYYQQLSLRLSIGKCNFAVQAHAGWPNLMRRTYCN